MLLTLGGGDVQRGVLSTPHAEITSGAFSSKFTLPMICIYYTLLTVQPCIERKNTVATKFQVGGEILARGFIPPPPPNEPLGIPILGLTKFYCISKLFKSCVS